MSRLRRVVPSGRYFFVTCNLLRTQAVLNEDDFEILARLMQARREEHGFLLTAWVFLSDPAAAGGAGVIWNGDPLEPPVIPVPLCGRNPVRRQHISEGLRSGFPLSRE